MTKNDVASFFYYMWNAWCRNECEAVFAGDNAEHFWSKWVGYFTEHRGYGAVEQFFANLSGHYQDMLVKRATEVYNRRQKVT